MATTITITGSGGAQVAGAVNPVGVQAGVPPELQTQQWGLFRFDIRPRAEESN